MLDPIKDWDDEYANMAHVPGSDALPAQWAKDAADYRASGVRIDRNIAYGDQPRAQFDLVLPDTHPKGLAVFIHGGYWMRLSKDDWTHLAQGACTQGWAVCLPSYTLAPDARISDMTQQMAAAVSKAAQMVTGPITICGHSAGGHLAARLACADVDLAGAVRKRIVHSLCISGLHDLRPLLQTRLNDTLQLDEAEATRESPALLRPATAAPITTWVGANERPEFLRQSRLLAQIWDGLDVPVSCVVDAGHDHFSILDDLRDPQSPITRALIGHA